MTGNLTEAELKKAELDLEREKLNFERTKAFIEFAKFGFAGTLTAAIAGIFLIFGLATLTAFSKTFNVSETVLIVMSVVILIGAVAFGYLSLWQLPKIAIHIQKISASVGEATKP